MGGSPYTYGPYFDQSVYMYMNPNAPYYEVGPDLERWWRAKRRHEVAMRDEAERQARMRLKWETNTWETGEMKTGADGYWQNYIAPGYYQQTFLELRGMATPTRNPFRAGGMQVHAVPEAERAVDTNGQRFPWAYEYADPDRASRISTEKGPFGRSTRRRTPSRSKTGTPSRKEDRDQAENWRVIDDIFTRAKEKEQTQDSQRPSTPSGGVLAIASGADSTGQAAQSTPSGTPTEVMLHGFPPAFQYAAIEFYERVSQGAILEDYDRYPPNTKYDLTLSLRRSRGTGKLSREALLKRNRYHGGDHWIKVTFDSAEAAERATYASPHIINGYVVYAEAYRGVGPAVDEAYLATPAAQEAIASATVSPSQRSSATLQQQNMSTASDTASSATATASGVLLDPFTSSVGPSRSALTPQAQPQPNGSLTSPPTLSANLSSSTAVQSSPERPLRIRGAKRAVLLPAEQALLPATSRWQRVFGSWPLIGLLLGGGSDLIGDAVPRDAAGNFDAVNASLYWLFWWWIDWIFGSDFCGLKGED